MHVSVVTNPKVDRLLAPACDSVQLHLQTKQGFFDKLQLRVTVNNFLNIEDLSLQFITGGLQRILKFTQRA